MSDNVYIVNILSVTQGREFCPSWDLWKHKPPDNPPKLALTSSQSLCVCVVKALSLPKAHVSVSWGLETHMVRVCLRGVRTKPPGNSVFPGHGRKPILWLNLLPKKSRIQSEEFLSRFHGRTAFFPLLLLWQDLTFRSNSIDHSLCRSGDRWKLGLK